MSPATSWGTEKVYCQGVPSVIQDCSAAGSNASTHRPSAWRPRTNPIAGSKTLRQWPARRVNVVATSSRPSVRARAAMAKSS